MRRTYKSRKDVPGAMDPRDVLLDDSKASVFDAFYIQNLKQTKREMSVGSTFHYAASNKVRKRKYVKRLKEQEITLRESTSRSAFLTPDKSFRVNKAPDLFDQLLNSSPVNILPPAVQRQLSNKPQVKPGRICNKKKQQKYKKLNYSSSDSSGSDKENISNDDTTKDSSDIKNHELVIERKKSVILIDQSINNIINNLSFFNHQNKNENSSINSSNIVIKKIGNSPMCSTPFNEKYRGKSIYKFSPISINLEDSPKCLNTDEKNNSCNVTVKTNCDSSPNFRKSIILHIPGKHFSSGKLSAKNESYPNVPENNAILQKEHNVLCFSKIDTNLSDNKVIDIDNKHEASNYESLRNSKLEELPQLPLTSLDSSQNCVVMELTNIEKHQNYSNIESLDCSLEDFPSKPFLGFTKIETENSISTNSEVSCKNSTKNLSESLDTESLYDTCDSDNQDEMCNIKEPIVVMNRLNDSVLQKYLQSDFSHTNSDDSYSANYDNHKHSNYHESTEESENSISCKTIDVSTETVKTSELQIEPVLAESNLHSNYDDLLKQEDICVSFVTTRRRNEITNDSFIITSDNSFNNFNDSFDNKICGANSVDIEEISLDNDTKVSEASDTETKLNVTMIDSCQNITIQEPIINNKQVDNVRESDKTSLKIEGNAHKITEDDLNEYFTTRKVCKSTDYQHMESCENNSYKKTVPIRKSTRLTKQRQAENQLDSTNEYDTGRKSVSSTSDNVGQIKEVKHTIMLKPGKKWERSLSIYRRMTTTMDHFDSSILDDEYLENKGRKYRQSVISTMEMQDFTGLDHNVSINSRRSTFVSKPIRSTIRIIKELNASNVSICSTTSDETQGFLTEDCDDTVIELSKLSIADYEPEVTILEKFHDTSNRRVAARDYVLRRCNQSDAILFDECYPDNVLKNCRKIGEGVYGEVFLWRAGDGRARVLKIIPIAGSIKVNGEDQKDYDEIISEIVIAMELSALRTPVPEIEKHLDEGKSIETLDLHSVGNATDIFNEVLAVRCVYGAYPARLLDLWELYDESRGSENDSPASLPPSQHFLVLELANAGQDLEGFHFTNAEQAYSVFRQVAFGLAVAEEAFQFEHRDLHWGNVLISPTDQKCATFVVGGRLHRVARRGVAATIIDYSLSRVSLALGGARAALYNDLGADEALFDAAGDYQFEVYRLMRDKLANEWKNFEPYTNILWLHYTADKMITALRYTRTSTKLHKHFIGKLQALKDRVLTYDSALQLVLNDQL